MFIVVIFSILAIVISIYTLIEIRNIITRIESLNHRSVGESTDIKKLKEDISSLDDDITQEYYYLDERIDAIQNRMDDHYRWSLGIWNDIAKPQNALANPIPDSLNDTLVYDNVYSGEVTPMGPQE